MSKSRYIAAAIAAAGSQADLARKSGLSQQHISKLLLKQRGVSAEAAVRIEAATGGRVRKNVLRPDLWLKRRQKSEH